MTQCDGVRVTVEIEVSNGGYTVNLACTLLKLDAPEEDLVDGSVPAHVELSEHSERMFENICVKTATSL